MADSDMQSLEKRIEEFGTKSTQILTFLSFAMVVVATLGTTVADSDQKLAMHNALKWWLRALYPVLFGVVPLKDFCPNKWLWYQMIRWLKFFLLWIDVGLIFLGLRQFAHAV